MRKNQNNASRLPARYILWRGICGLCPRCRKGKIFVSYLKQIDYCLHCREDIRSLQADDGPAWLTILLTGHIMGPFIGYFALNDVAPQWFLMFILLSFIIGLALLLLPRLKGLFIAALWLIKYKNK